MASNIIACRKLGCRKSFKSYQQRIRHESKCEKSEVMPVLQFDHVVEDTCDEIDFLHPYEYANETDEMDDYERGYDDEAVPADFTDITEIEQCAAADVPVVILLPDGTQVNHLNEVVNVVVEDVQQCENESSGEDNNAIDTNTEARRKVVEQRTSDVCRANSESEYG